MFKKKKTTKNKLKQSIEEIKTIRNSDGKEETVVKRIIGDKMHAVTEKRNKEGVRETEELFHNMNESLPILFIYEKLLFSFFFFCFFKLTCCFKDDLSEFEQMWNNLPSTSTERKQNPVDGMPGKSKNNYGDEQSLVAKLFSWLKK